MTQDEFELQLLDRETFGMNNEEELHDYDGETFQGDFAMVNPAETLGVMPTAYASEGSQE